MLEIPISILDILGVMGFIISGCLGVLELYRHLFLRPRLVVTFESGKVVREGHKYGYLNLVVTNKGKQTASDCVIILTIDGSNFVRQRLLWHEPLHLSTFTEPTTTIYGEDDKKISNLFEIDEGQTEVLIKSEEGREAKIEVGKAYTFRVNVHSAPYGKGTTISNVNVKAWDNIIVTQEEKRLKEQELPPAKDVPYRK